MAANPFTPTHHCEIFWSEAHGGNTNYRKCQINPGHKDFLSVAEFGIEHLPRNLKTQSHYYYVKDLIDRTVNIKLNSTSKNRPDHYPASSYPYPCIELRGDNQFMRGGTGFLSDSRSVKRRKGACPCPGCRKSEKPKNEFWIFTVSTSSHVVFDDIEATSVVAEAFYDTEDRRGVKYLYGLFTKGNVNDRYQTDACDVVCVTHDPGVADRLTTSSEFNTMGYEEELRKLEILISHPHGASKKITRGRFHKRHYLDEEQHPKSVLLDRGIRVSLPSETDEKDDDSDSDDASGCYEGIPETHNTDGDIPETKDCSPGHSFTSTQTSVESSTTSGRLVKDSESKPAFTSRQTPVESTTTDSHAKDSESKPSFTSTQTPVKSKQITIASFIKGMEPKLSTSTQTPVKSTTKSTTIADSHVNNPESNPFFTSTHTPDESSSTTTGTLNVPEKYPETNNPQHQHQEKTTPKAVSTFHELLTPTEEANTFLLEVDMRAVQPPYSYTTVTDETDWDTGVPSGWTSFPFRTEFMTSDGTKLDVPMGTKFWLPSVSSPHNYSVILYDMPACPGSSGAPVFFDFPIFAHWRHFGTSQSGKLNQSGFMHDWLKVQREQEMQR